jgi:hypothetical protein
VPKRVASAKSAIAAWTGGVPRVIATRWPSVRWASHGMLALVGAFALSLVLIAGLALGPLSSAVTRPSASPSVGSSASDLAAGESPSSEPWTTGWAQTPAIQPNDFSYEPIDTSPPSFETNPDPSAPSGARKPKVLATAACPTVYVLANVVVSGDTIYAACDNPAATTGASPNPAAGLSLIRTFNATTGKTVGTYSVPVLDEGVYHLEVDNGLWYSTGPFCPMGCPVFTPHVRRMDLTSHKVTLDLAGWEVASDGLGYVWAQKHDQVGPALLKIDPATGNTSQIPWKYQRVEVACGALWGLDNSKEWLSTTVARVDPATGNVLASFTDAGYIRDLQQTADGCWAREDLKQPAGSSNNSARFVKIGSSGIAAGSPAFSVSWGDNLSILDGTFWIFTPPSDSEWTYLQRIDPASWQRVGTVWALRFYPPGWNQAAYVRGLFAAGAIWVMTDSGAPTGDYRRLDIQVGATPTPSTPSPTPAPSPSPSLEPSAPATPSPSS